MSEAASNTAAQAPVRSNGVPPPLKGGLLSRAARPQPTRIRSGAVKLVAGAAAIVLTAAFGYAFILAPELKVQARELARQNGREAPRAGDTRPIESITEQPSSYDRLKAPAEAPAETNVEMTGSALDEPPPAYPATAYARTAPSSRLASRTGPSSAALAAGSSLFFEAAGGPEKTPRAIPTGVTGLALKSNYAEVYGSHALLDPLSPNELKAGTMIPAALQTALDTGRPGPVLATVTAPVFDTVTGTILLLPQGTKLLGRQGGDSRYGEKRAYLIWTRLILPNGKSLTLEDEQATDPGGATGLPGRVDRRLLQLGGAVLAGAAVTTLGELARDRDDDDGGFWPGAGAAASIEASQVGARLIDRELSVKPTIRVRAGSPVRVLLTRDLILEPYAS
jgi:type IV secretion system protein VirB10